MFYIPNSSYINTALWKLSRGWDGVGGMAEGGGVGECDMGAGRGRGVKGGGGGGGGGFIL